MDYTYLTSDEQADMLRNRLRQLESEHLGHALNVQEWTATLPGLDSDNRKAVLGQIAASELAIQTLDRKYLRTKARLDAAPAPVA